MRTMRTTVTDEHVNLALPIFVFGTLRPGNGNSATWRGMGEAAHDGEAIVRDYRLVSNGAFPYMLPSEGEATTGCMIVPFIQDYRQCLQQMDILEGVPNHYDRIKVSVELPGMITTAWAYVPTDHSYYERLNAVPNNDWTDRQPRTRGITDWYN